MNRREPSAVATVRIGRDSASGMPSDSVTSRREACWAARICRNNAHAVAGRIWADTR